MSEDVGIEGKVMIIDSGKTTDHLKEDITGDFNVVMRISWKGELLSAKVNEPMQAFDPEEVSSAATITAWVSKNLASMLGGESVHEIDIVMNNKFMVILPEKDEIRLAISSAV